MKRDLVIFDLDGTLLNSVTDLAVCVNRALEDFGFPGHSEEAYKRMLGDGVAKLIWRAVPEDRRDQDTLTRVHAAFDRYYDVHGSDCTRPYDGIPAMLEEVKGGGMQTAVLSNKAHQFVPALMALHFPGLIDYALGNREGVPLKPDPTAVFEIMNHFGVEKDACVYVGDSDVDMKTGVNAGLHSIGVTWGYRTEEELNNAGAMDIVHKVDRLAKIILDK